MPLLVRRFRSLCEDLCRVIEQEGLVVRPYTLPSMPFFQALPLEERAEVYEHLRHYYEICESSKKEGSSLRDEEALVRKALKHFGMEVDEKVFKWCGDRVVYEFYSAHQVQIFRTVNFFEFNSYTIEDLYSRSWFHLYQRDEHITSKILEYAHSILSEKVRDVVEPDVPVHLLTERASLEKLRLPVQFLCLAPLTKGGQVVGILCAIRSAGDFLVPEIS